MVLLRRKQVVIMALVAMIAVAGYLNWAYTGSYTGEEGTEHLAKAAAKQEETKNLGEAQMVNATDVENAAKTAKSEENDFFTQARLDREVARSKSVETFGAIIGDEMADEAAKTTAQNEVMELAKRSETEVTIESLIRAKGYKDAVVYLNNDSCNVIVKVEALSQEDVAKISDIITEQSGVPADKIKIVEIK